MKLGIPKEITPGETRTAAVPETIKKLAATGLEVAVEAGAGQASFIADAEFEAAGAAIAADAEALYGQAEIVLKVLAPTTDPPPATRKRGKQAEAPAGRAEIEMLASGSILIAMLAPLSNPQLAQRLAEANITSFALDAMPRTTRAQSMDVLSSMATIAGYKAVLRAADELAKMMPMMMTAAGTIRPASALIIGAGVAGLQAIATAKRLGAVVTAVDVRPAVREQIESLGAKFVAMEVEHQAETAGGYAADLGEAFYKQEQDILAPHVKQADIVISTAMIPGRPAPVLITESMVDQMKPGSAIVDLAVATGGNCTLTKPDQRVERNGVAVLGPTNLPADLPIHASMMFARNAAEFVKELVAGEGQVDIDLENEIIRGTLITHEGKVVHEGAKKALGQEEQS